MSRIRGKNTKPELLLRKYLWHQGLRYRIHFPVVGKPDIVFLSKKIAVFVDGCFWHGCPLHGVRPKTNVDFWANKIQGNISRDRDVTLDLESQGWIVLRFWEHEIKADVGEVSRQIETVVRARS